MSGIPCARSLSEISEEGSAKFGVDLVASARRNIGFLRHVSDSHWLHRKSTILEAIRRYDKLWMPLIADLTTGPKPPMILPPLDVHWVWFCHTLNPASYRYYCEKRFSKLVGKAAIFDDENEEYALNRCREIWESKFLSEPFENEAGPDSGYQVSSSLCQELFDQVSSQRNLYTRFSEPYYSEMVYLVAAKQRYEGFIDIARRFSDECFSLVPPADVLLLWLTHQSYPTVYAVDVKELDEDVEKIVGVWETVKEEDIEQTKILWERNFDQPYEKAGGAAIVRSVTHEPPFYWDITHADVNTRYNSLGPRFLFEVCVSVKPIPNIKQTRKEFLRLRMMKSHRELKMDKPLSTFTTESWQKSWHLYCEFGTKGVILELRFPGGPCSRGSSLMESISFSWNELLREPSLTSMKEIDERMQVFASITPPVQSSYLLKCVPDRVTDDSGAMISDVILRMNQYHPQEGRWLSRTVLDHAARECFVVRMRVGEGFWRRGGEVPKAVKWEERSIEICEGSWSYVVGSNSIGRSPEKVVGTASPIESTEGYQASWSFSTGHVLSIQWDPSTQLSEMRLDLQNQESSGTMVRLLLGRKLQYQVLETGGVERSDENEFLTVIRYSEENPTGKATALMNWKLLIVELLPEEDAVLALLICLSILRSVSEMKREDVGSLLLRRRVREAKIGERDLGSVILHNSAYSASVSTPNLQPWYWDARLVMTVRVKDQFVGPPSNYSQVEGGDKLFKSGIIS